MMIMKPMRLGAVAVFLSVCITPAFARDARYLNTALLSRQVSALAARAKPGVLGVAVQDVRGGTVWSFQGAWRFPMQSVFKAPLAAAVLDRVDRKTVSLAAIVVLHRSDLHGGPIADKFKGASESFTVRQLLRASIIDSDNSAADALLRVIGGPRSVTAYLRVHGIRDMRVDRSEQMLARTMAGVPNSVPLGVASDDAIRKVPLETRRRAFAGYFRDPRDTATPIAAATFLVQLQRGKLLSPSATALLLGDMGACRTGIHRLKAGLPAGARLAHKTGTSGVFEGVSAATNDVGVVTLHSGRQLAVAVFLEASPAPEADRESVIANVARAIAAAAR